MGKNQSDIQNRFSFMFFGVAILCFISVAEIPGFLESRLIFIREVSNGSYYPLSYAIANFLIGLPFIALIALVFTIIVYPSVGLNSDFEKVVIFYIFFFLSLLVAESISIFISALVPIFVAALAIVSFMNGFFMVV